MILQYSELEKKNEEYEEHIEIIYWLLRHRAQYLYSVPTFMNDMNNNIAPNSQFFDIEKNLLSDYLLKEWRKKEKKEIEDLINLMYPKN